MLKSSSCDYSYEQSNKGTVTIVKKLPKIMQIKK